MFHGGRTDRSAGTDIDVGTSNKIVDELRALRKVLEDKNIHKGD